MNASPSGIKRSSATGSPPIVVVVTMNGHLVGALERAARKLGRAGEPVDLRVHVAADWDESPDALDACLHDLDEGHVVLVSQLFLEDQAEAVRPTLVRNRDRYDALVCVLSAGSIVRLTRMGRLDMGGEGEPRTGSKWSPMSLLKKMKGERRGGRASGRRQMRVLRMLPKVLRYVPGTAQDLRAYVLSVQGWLAGSEANLAELMSMLLGRYRHGETGRASEPEFRAYPDKGVYHPGLGRGGISEDAGALPADGSKGTVGLLLMRSYLLAGNTAHYDAVIRSLETRGLRVIPAFASGLDNREAVTTFFMGDDGRPVVDCVLSLTGFSLVGGPAYADTDGAHALLAEVDVPCLTVVPLEFQTVQQWEDDARGLSPLQTALMVSVPELDGAVAPHVFAGRRGGGGKGEDMSPIPERVEALSARIARLVALRRSERAERRLGVVLFNFPPNAGSVGTAAYLDVWASLQAFLERLADEGYSVEVPDDVDALRDRILGGNAERLGTPANVAARTPVDGYVRETSWLEDIEQAWGPAPGRALTDGASLFVLGARFGNVFVGVQPPFGIEGDPMRLLFEGGFAPTHAFANFYRWLRSDFRADALLHFGTHGALEFMPGKHVGLSERCWPDRLLGDLPNYYLYAANNPSEGTLAKRRSMATLVTYLTPPVARAGLYKGLLELRADLDRAASASDDAERDAVAEGIRARVESLDLQRPEDDWTAPDQTLGDLRARLFELEHALVPHGLHVLGRATSAEERAELLAAIAEAGIPEAGVEPLEDIPDALREACASLAHASSPDPEGAIIRDALTALGSAGDDARKLATHLADIDGKLRTSMEMEGILRALDGRHVPPAPGGDVLRRPAILPTGRNLYGFDPYRVPSAAGLADGRRMVDVLLSQVASGAAELPETVAMVLWGSDTMKREGAPVAQALALMGAEPRFDAYGRLTGARLIDLETLGRPRIDVVMTLSGVFRDLLPLQVRLLAEAAVLAASADEPEEQNFVRRNTRARMESLGCSFEEAALRVFSNDEGAYGANVNQLVERSVWDDEDALGRQFMARKSFGYGTDGRSTAHPELLEHALAGAALTFQNLDSVEMGVTDVDQYVDSLGGMSRAATAARGSAVPVFLGDETRGTTHVRGLDEQIALETRTRVLNPSWYEAMLSHGYQGVRELETRVTAAFGWSATTGATPEWVYRQVGETFVLDDAMRHRLAELNPHATAGVAARLTEACDRGYWNPNQDTLDALTRASEELEDRIEGVEPEFAA